MKLPCLCLCVCLGRMSLQTILLRADLEPSMESSDIDNIFITHLSIQYPISRYSVYLIESSISSRVSGSRVVRELDYGDAL